MGYEVRLTRSSNNEHPSFAKRSTYCFKNNDTSTEPDADLYVCIHSNAGDTSGTSYISTSGGKFDQKYISSNFSEECNKAGKIINDKIVSETSLKLYNNGVISSEPDLIAFHKNPVTTAYLEIGFFDNDLDLQILNSETDKIGKAIAEGIDEYLGGSGEEGSSNGALGKDIDTSQYYAIVAKWSENHVDTNDPKEVSKHEYKLEQAKINYKEFVSGYTMPFDYLWTLLVMGGKSTLPLDLSDLIQDSKIEITVHDNESTNTTTKKRTEETTDNKGKKHSVTYTTTTTVKSDNIKVALTLADVWIAKYKQDFKYEKTSNGNKYTSSPRGSRRKDEY